jgi:hypothetical protein
LPFLDLVAYSFSFSGRSREGSQAAAAGGAPTWTTELQQHVAYFDTDNDGIVTYSETEAGVTKMAIDRPSSPKLAFPSFLRSPNGESLAVFCIYSWTLLTSNFGLWYTWTVAGLRRIGLGGIAATAAATLINGVIGPKTRPVRSCSLTLGRLCFLLMLTRKLNKTSLLGSS